MQTKSHGHVVDQYQHSGHILPARTTVSIPATPTDMPTRFHQTVTLPMTVQNERETFNTRYFQHTMTALSNDPTKLSSERILPTMARFPAAGISPQSVTPALYHSQNHFDYLDPNPQRPQHSGESMVPTAAQIQERTKYLENGKILYKVQSDASATGTDVYSERQKKLETLSRIDSLIDQRLQSLREQLKKEDEESNKLLHTPHDAKGVQTKKQSKTEDSNNSEWTVTDSGVIHCEKTPKKRASSKTAASKSQEIRIRNPVASIATPNHTPPHEEQIPTINEYLDEWTFLSGTDSSTLTNTSLGETSKSVTRTSSVENDDTKDLLPLHNDTSLNSNSKWTLAHDRDKKDEFVSSDSRILNVPLKQPAKSESLLMRNIQQGYDKDRYSQTNSNVQISAVKRSSPLRAANVLTDSQQINTQPKWDAHTKPQIAFKRQTDASSSDSNTTGRLDQSNYMGAFLAEFKSTSFNFDNEKMQKPNQYLARPSFEKDGSLQLQKEMQDLMLLPEDNDTSERNGRASGGSTTSHVSTSHQSNLQNMYPSKQQNTFGTTPSNVWTDDLLYLSSSVNDKNVDNVGRFNPSWTKEVERVTTDDPKCNNFDDADYACLKRFEERLRAIDPSLVD
ncbi:hypothetical protein RFI_05827 [Reticulomyxa filosa]|uniref:Uncharacterized protein n=1 Tax=Reticulomyxa filosa TaxID=46433 RepID=X6NZM1_RETFI|nr:hypothetical protein RFI_05827 [Reticulomyxa filosa]|eukprot:ETO31294.1 hypothetical protein RFI_05827 [Reticulomyxa filosa]